MSLIKRKIDEIETISEAEFYELISLMRTSRQEKEMTKDKWRHIAA